MVVVSVAAAVSVVVVLAVEPFLRRRWPRTIAGWNRLFAGRVRDPLVGRDVLFGLTAGVGSAVWVCGVCAAGLVLRVGDYWTPWTTDCAAWLPPWTRSRWSANPAAQRR